MTRKYAEIPFKEAAAYKMTFGKYEGTKLDGIAITNSGLLYLDWLRGSQRLDFHTNNAINSYLDDPTITKDLNELIQAKKAKIDGK